MPEANTNEAIKFDVQITEEDYFQFNSAFFPKTTRFILWVIALVYLLIVIVGMIQKGLSALGYAPFMWFFVVLPFILHFTVKQAVRRAYHNKFLQETKHYCATPEEISYVAPSSTMRTEWKDIKRVIETKKMIVLFIATNAAHLIPFRSFTKLDDLSAFKQIVHEKIPLSVRKPPVMGKIMTRVGIYLFIFLVTIGIVRFLASH